MSERRKLLTNTNWNTLKSEFTDYKYFNVLPSLEIIYTNQGFYETGINTPWCKELSIQFRWLIFNTQITWYWDFYN